MAESQSAESAADPFQNRKGKAGDLLAELRSRPYVVRSVLATAAVTTGCNYRTRSYRCNNPRRSREAKDEAVQPDASAVPPAANLTGHSGAGRLRVINNSSP